MSDGATDETVRARAEPRGRAILRLVAGEELAAGEIAAAFEVTRTAISQHLAVLKNAGVLAERRDGTRRLYRAPPEGLAGLRQFLDEMWASSLDTARRLLESERGITDDEPAARPRGPSRRRAAPAPPPRRPPARPAPGRPRQR